MSDELTEAELMELQQYLGAGAPTPEEKHSVHTFLHKVATADDTTKVGNVGTDELGMPKLPVRTQKELAIFCKDIANMNYFADYFTKMSEVTTSTSLSKDAKLIELAVITRKQVEALSKPRRQNKGWFQKKEPAEEV